MKTRFMVVWAVFLCMAFSSYAEKRPNILFILSDDHTREGISTYGSWLKDHCRTPNIDRLANEGMRFNRTFCNNSICTPSRASILTGQYSHANGVTQFGRPLRPGVPMFSEELQENGYTTALVGKWHIPNEPEGYDYHVRITNLWSQGSYFNPELVGTEHLKPKGFSADVYTDLALDWLDKKRDKTRPFALSLHYKSVHSSFECPKRVRRPVCRRDHSRAVQLVRQPRCLRPAVEAGVSDPAR